MSRLSVSLTLGAVLLFSLFSLVQGLSFTAYWRRHFVHQQQHGSWTVAEQIARKFSPSLEPEPDFSSLRRSADEVLETNPDFEIYLLEPSGRVNMLFSREPRSLLPKTKIDLAPIEAFLRPGARKDAPLFAPDPQSPDRSVIYSAAPAPVTKAGGFVYVVLTNRRAARIQTRTIDAGVFFGILISSIAALTIAAIVGLFSSRHLVKRLRGLMSAVRKLAQGRLDTRAEISGRDEITELSSALNLMALSLQSSHRELERKDILRRELIANVWHDVRGPVAVLQGLGSLLTSGAGAEKAELIAQGVLANASQLNHFLDELHALSSLETGEREIRNEAVDLVELADEAVAAIRPQAEQSGVRLSIEIANAEGAIASGDSALLSRLLRNLVENALRYTPENGEVIISIEQHPELLILSVKDTGIGISEEDLPKVFERSYQSRRGNEGRYGSGGLGLTIVRKIAEAHGSNVSVQSREGMGTTFSVQLKRYRSTCLQGHDQAA